MDKRTQILDIIRRVAGKEPPEAVDESLFDNIFSRALLTEATGYEHVDECLFILALACIQLLYEVMLR